MKYSIIFFALFILGSCVSSKSWPDPPYQVITPSETFQVASQECDETHCVLTNCPSDMVQVIGDYCPNLEEDCLEWIDTMRCKRFKEPTVCHGEIQHMNFCIDKYEYPNHLGERPSLQNTWYQAQAQCQAQNKRLCIDNEWTQACRGPDNLPYPYGYTRDANACRIDLPWQDPTTHTFEQLDKTVPSGSMPACVSGYGVYDMTGNADEWAVNPSGKPFKSDLKGGHPHGVRNRCTPATYAHNEYFSFYDTGFRCCKDVP